MLTKGKNDRGFIHMKLDLTILYKSFLSSFHNAKCERVNLSFSAEKRPMRAHVIRQITRNFKGFHPFRSLRRFKAGRRNGNHPAIPLKSLHSQCIRSQLIQSGNTNQENNLPCKHCRKSIIGREELSFFCLLFSCLDGDLLNGKLFSQDLY